jgi:hypothetical protein
LIDFILELLVSENILHPLDYLLPVERVNHVVNVVHTAHVEQVGILAKKIDRSVIYVLLNSFVEIENFRLEILILQNFLSLPHSLYGYLSR